MSGPARRDLTREELVDAIVKNGNAGSVEDPWLDHCNPWLVADNIIEAIVENRRRENTTYWNSWIPIPSEHNPLPNPTHVHPDGTVCIWSPGVAVWYESAKSSGRGDPCPSYGIDQ